MNNKSISNRYLVVGALLLVTLTLATACSGAATAGPTETGDTSVPLRPLTEEALKNAAYHSEWPEDGIAQLTDGEYRKPIVEGSATELLIRLMDVAFGDLDGDGVSDAAVVLVTDPGGSGTFYELAAVVNQDGNPEHVATISLGDRAQIEALSVKAGQIVVEMITHGPDDPMCCPTQQVVQTYALQGDGLVQVSSEIVSSEPAGDPVITSIEWRWSGLIETMPAAQSVVPDPENYTLILQPDGGLHIKADCNVVGGSHTLEGDGLTIALGPSTMAYCGEQSLDQQFQVLLSNVDGYGIEDGQLVLKLQADAGSMIFSK
jgi:heat shock protein HslJ